MNDYRSVVTRGGRKVTGDEDSSAPYRHEGFRPDATYVSKFLQHRKQELRGLHMRIEETERIRYLEDVINLPNDEAKSGIEVRVGASAELIKNVKGAITTNPPRYVLKPATTKQGAGENAHKREQFLNRLLERWDTEYPAIGRFADSMIANGVGFLKGARTDYPRGPLARLKKSNGQFAETESEHNARVKALKRIWGPPLEVVDVHPLAAFFQRGRGNKVSEIAEHSYKPKPEMFRNYGITNQTALRDAQLSGTRRLNKDTEEIAQLLRSQSGHPDEEIKSLPFGADTSTMVLVTEYWSPDCYQVYVDRRLIWEEWDPHISYFMALGEITSSNDPDKLAFGVAEIMRHNEPAVNRSITRILEANELVGRRTAVELPEGSVDYEDIGGDGVPQPKVYKFRTDVGVSLPPGARIAHPFDGVQHVYQSLPTVNLLLSIMAEHGVSPLFKGNPVSSDSSGYRENSLYMMAKSQLQEILKSYRYALAELGKWVEKEIVDMGETVYLDELELSPSDITPWPAQITVELDPKLPQNMIAEGSFWDRMWASGHVPRRWVREQGFQAENPDALEREKFVEDIKEQLKPQLTLDIMTLVFGQDPNAMGGQPEGQPEGMLSGVPGDNVTQRPGTGSMGRELGGYSRAGQPREQAGTTI